MSRQKRIYKTLTNKLEPEIIIVDDESNMHSVPDGAESHFKLTIVSPRFENVTRINRHRLINSLLSTEFEIGLHALSLHLYTPAEWDGTTPKSPACKGGSRHG